MNAVTRAETLQENRRLGSLGAMVVRIGGGIGLAALAAALLLASQVSHGWEHLYQAYVTSFCYVLSLSLGALFFVLLQHLTRSGWSVTLRRIAEGFLPHAGLLLVLFVPLLAGLYALPAPAHEGAAAGGELHGARAVWLDHRFVTVRYAVYWAVWGLLGACFAGWSARQDASGDIALTRRMEKLGAPAMLVYAITVTFASFDLLMSRDPHWYSTIYGVYFFAGSVVGFFALLPLVAFLLQCQGRTTASIAVDHYHNMGKLLFGFTVFWAYIAYSQYMLIWYGNIPEETVWYLRRQTGPWTARTLALLFGHFVVPFLALLSRYPKRRPALLATAAVWMLVMHWLDVFWLSRPEAHGGMAAVTVFDGLCLVGVGGLFVATAAWRLGRGSLVPERDPRLAEALAFHDV